MLGFASLSLRVGVIAGLVLAAGSTSPFAQQKVGINSAVNPDATGTPPGAATRKLVIGQDVVFNEHITTGPLGQTQLLFLDESSMTVGPSSDLTIDEFVFDPNTGTGKLAMSATKGLLRYVGGKLSKQDNAVTLRTSTATLAVRGGAFIANILTDGTTKGIFIYGKGLSITGANGAAQILTRPGFSSQTTPGGGGPSTPGPTPPGEMAGYQQALDGRSGGTGGASTIPTDTSVSNSGISQTISGDVTGSIEQSLQNGGGSGLAGTTTFTGGSLFTFPTPNTVQSSSAQTTLEQQQQPPQPPPVAVTVAGRAKSTIGRNPAFGFVDQSATGDIAYASGTLTSQQGAQASVFSANVGVLGTVSLPLVPGQSVSFQGTSSALGAISGTGFLSADKSYFFARFAANSDPTHPLFITGGTPVNASALAQTGATRILAFSVQPDAALQSTIPFVRSQAGGSLPGATVSPLLVAAPPSTPIGDATTISAARALQASLAVSGQGASQQSTIAVTTGTFGALQSNGQPILSGALRGSSLQDAAQTPVRLGSSVTSTVDGAGNSIYGGSAISGFVLDQSQVSQTSPGIATTPTANTATEHTLTVSGTGNQNYGFAQPVLPQVVPAGVGANRTTQVISGNFGGLMYTTAQPATPYIVAGGTAIATDAPTNRIQATLTGAALTPSAGVNTLTMQYGGLTGNAAGRQAFIDNSTFAVLETQDDPARQQQINGNNLTLGGDPNQAGRIYLVSSGAAGAPAALLPSGVAYCDCQFLQWGYWGGDLRTDQRIDRGHINTWVAGVATPVGDLNTLAAQAATGVYNGHLIGSVFNNGASYLAAGGFTGTYQFATQQGAFAVSNFDGRSFTAAGPAPLNGSTYSAVFNNPLAPNGSVVPVAGKLNGTFYGPAAANTGGSFGFASTVPGINYLASGIFAGKR